LVRNGAQVRANVSVPPPGDWPMISLIVLPAKSAAKTGEAIVETAATANAAALRMARFSVICSSTVFMGVSRAYRAKVPVYLIRYQD
jgi:hypothetical protein